MFVTISKCLFFSATATSCTLGVTAFGRIATVQRYRDGYVPKVYLAGPFFTLEEPWVVGQARRDLKAMGLDVFSPYHDVGLGTAEDVVKKTSKDCATAMCILQSAMASTRARFRDWLRPSFEQARRFLCRE